MFVFAHPCLRRPARPPFADAHAHHLRQSVAIRWHAALFHQGYEIACTAVRRGEFRIALAARGGVERGLLQEALRALLESSMPPAPPPHDPHGGRILGPPCTSEPTFLDASDTPCRTTDPASTRSCTGVPLRQQRRSAGFFASCGRAAGAGQHVCCAESDLHTLGGAVATEERVRCAISLLHWCSYPIRPVPTRIIHRSLNEETRRGTQNRNNKRSHSFSRRHLLAINPETRYVFWARSNGYEIALSSGR